MGKRLRLRLSKGVRAVKNARGQASIMIGMMMMTFMMFFTFVVYTGTLVNAKINLQNAADLAAYAGAAVQARQLNQISYLNYEMRRAYKKFLFRYYVIGNMAQKSHPTSAGGGPRIWSPDGNPANDLRVPSVCMIVNSGDVPCQVAKVKPVSIPQNLFNDVISGSLEGVLRNIEQVRQRSCLTIGQLNLQILLFWLFNTDPSLESITQALNSIGGPDPEKARQRLTVLRALTAGLGLVPREILHKMRIDSLAEYVNASSRVGVNLSTANTLVNGNDAVANERTIQAYFSAFNTLGSNTFTEPVLMDEVLPTSAVGANLLKLNTITTTFDAYGTYMYVGDDPKDAAASQASLDTKPCTLTPVPFSLKNAPVPVGVYKDPSVLTHYAIRLTGKAKVMFGGEVTLKAYSAALPFGSRIGPKLTEDDWRNDSGDKNFCAGTGSASGVDCVNKVPNLPVRTGEILSRATGWATRDMIYGVYSNLLGATANSEPVININAIERGYQAAMAPNPYEKAQYNILISDVGNPSLHDIKDGYVRNFDADGIYSFWAPLVTQAGVDLKTEISQKIDSIITPDSATGSGATATVFNPQIRDALKAGIEAYVQKLLQGAGEQGEGINIARISDPYNTKPAQGRQKIQIPFAGMDPQLMLEPTTRNVKTSWGGVKDKELGSGGRTGYSVKFISLRHLAQPTTLTSDGSSKWFNTGALKQDLGADLGLIQH